MISVYIHWPFCISKCPYCDFNSHVRDSVDNKAWQNALLKELEYYLQQFPQRKISTVFFGGGTPSLMPPETVAALIERIHHHGASSDMEVTLEANPGSTEQKKFQAFKQAGVNRVSIGIQSLNNEHLKFLGRQHSAAEAINAIEVASSVFERYSFDLIFGLPNQSLEEWQVQLKQALSLAGGHISLYQLTIEEGTNFYHLYQAGKLKMPDTDTLADFYEATLKYCAENNYQAYEISNFAKSGNECRHNLNYWKYGDYIGVGAGAHGRFVSNDSNLKTSTINEKSPEKWLAMVNEKDCGLATQTIITPDEMAREFLMMNLRLKSGFNVADMQAVTGIKFEDAITTDACKNLCEMGLLRFDNNILSATNHGFMVLDSVIRALL